MNRLANLLLPIGLVCARLSSLHASDPEYQKALDEAIRFCPPGDYNNARAMRPFVVPVPNYDLSKADLTTDPPMPVKFQEGIVMNQLIALPKGVDFFPAAVEELQRKYPQAFASSGLTNCAKSLRELNDKLLREGCVYLSTGQLYQRRATVMNVTKTLPASETRITLRKGTPVIILEAPDDYQIMIGRMTFRLQPNDVVLP